MIATDYRHCGSDSKQVLECNVWHLTAWIQKKVAYSIMVQQERSSILLYLNKKKKIQYEHAGGGGGSE